MLTKKNIFLSLLCLLAFMVMMPGVSAQQGYLQIKEISSTPVTSLSNAEAEIVFVSDNNNLAIGGALSIDSVAPMYRRVGGRYEYSIQLQLKTKNGDFHRDRTFSVGIKGTSISEQFKKKSIQGGNRYKVNVVVPEHIIRLTDITKPNSLYASETEVCVAFQSLLELNIKASNVSGNIEQSRTETGLNQYKAILSLASINENSSLSVETLDGKSNVMQWDVSNMKKRESKTVEVLSTELEGVSNVADEYQFVIFEVLPVGVNSSLSFNGSKVELDKDGKAQKYVPFGLYSYKVVAPKYHTVAGDVVVNDANNAVVVQIQMRQATGALRIDSSRADGGMVYIDGEYVGTAPLTITQLSNGDHEVRIEKERFATFQTTIAIEDNKTISLAPPMRDSFAHLTLRAEANVEIWINNTFRGVGLVSDDFEQGPMLVTCKKKSCRDVNKTITVIAGKNDTIMLDSPEPIFGRLVVMSNPIGATIKLTDIVMGTTPKTLTQVPVGKRKIVLSYEGYVDWDSVIVIAEDKPVVLDVTMYKGSAPKRVAKAQTTDTAAQEPRVKTSSDKRPRRTFLMGGVTPTQNSWGQQLATNITIGQVKRVGWYINASSNFHVESISGTIYPNGQIVGGSSVILFDNKKPIIQYNLGVVGITARLAKPLYLYLGAGYGVRDYLVKGTNKRYYRLKKNCTSGIAAEGGLGLFLGPVSLSAGVTTIFPLNLSSGFTVYNPKGISGRVSIGFDF